MDNAAQSAEHMWDGLSTAIYAMRSAHITFFEEATPNIQHEKVW